MLKAFFFFLKAPPLLPKPFLPARPALDLRLSLILGLNCDSSIGGEPRILIVNENLSKGKIMLVLISTLFSILPLNCIGILSNTDSSSIEKIGSSES